MPLPAAHFRPVQSAVKTANAKVWGVAAFPERLAGPKFGGMIADRTRLVEGGVLNAMPRKVTVFAGSAL